MSNDAIRSTQRPTSPHISIYRKQISSVLSITHRMTGLALFAGMAVVVAWLWSAAYAPVFFGALHGILSSFIGKFCLLGWTISFYYHLGNGIRHLFWDMGKGFELPTMHKSGWAVVLSTILLTAFTWGVATSAGGH